MFAFSNRCGKIQHKTCAFLAFLAQRDMKYNLFLFCTFLIGLIIAVPAKENDPKNMTVRASLNSTTGAGKNYNYVLWETDLQSIDRFILLASIVASSSIASFAT